MLDASEDGRENEADEDGRDVAPRPEVEEVGQLGKGRVRVVEWVDLSLFAAVHLWYMGSGVRVPRRCGSCKL